MNQQSLRMIKRHLFLVNVCELTAVFNCVFLSFLLCLPLSTLSPCQVLTKDSVTVSVDGVVYYRVQNATLAVANITNADAATRLLAQTTLRNVLGTKNLSQILSDREEIAHSMQVHFVVGNNDSGEHSTTRWLTKSVPGHIYLYERSLYCTGQTQY